MKMIDYDYILELDNSDPLKHYREKFWIPKDDKGEELIYFCGNSLGLQPKLTEKYLQQELEDWKKLGVEGHAHAKNPWMPYHEFLTGKMAALMGAKPIEVVMMNSLTVNLHLLMVSFYRPNKKRYKILIENDAFPSDKYAVESQLKFHDFDPKEGLLTWKPLPGETTLRYEVLEDLLAREGENIALILIGGVNYYTGQAFDLQKISQLGHSYGCVVGFDLAHMAGNINPNLHDSGADFAAWCSYKYLNSGPGSVAGCFVHERHAYKRDIPRFTGWWGHNKTTRFNMRHDFDPIPGAEGWQLSNPPILSMAAIRASLDIFSEVGMEGLRDKSIKMMNLQDEILKNISSDIFDIITPSSPSERGCQMSIRIKNANKGVFNKLQKAGVICDWREPDVIRIAPTPFYNSFNDIYFFYQKLLEILNL